MLKRKNKRHSYRTLLSKIVHQQSDPSTNINIRWINPNANTCKHIQPQHYCFCGHFLSQHQHTSHNIDKCTADRCSCLQFYFIPDLNLKCICKHAPYRHDMSSQKCKQCSNCIGFVTDWVCDCGYRFEQHSMEVCSERVGEDSACVMSVGGKKSRLNNSVSFPWLAKLYPSNKDKVKQSLSVSLIKMKTDKIFHQLSISQNEYNRQNSELQHKLRQANLRYFCKFKGMTTMRVETQQKQQHKHEINALDLYIQPHNYRPFPLSKHLANILPQKH